VVITGYISDGALFGEDGGVARKTVKGARNTPRKEAVYDLEIRRARYAQICADGCAINLGRRISKNSAYSASKGARYVR
jgi:hypothetical protein